MSSLDNLTAKILKDAEDEKTAILAEAEKEKEKILSKKKDEADKEAKVILERAKRDAQSREERLVSGAELSARNEKLGAKQQVIQEVFDLTVDELSNCSADDFKEFLKETILSGDVRGDQNLILNAKGKEIVDNSLITEINSALSGKAVIKLSDEVRNFKGGFVLEQNGIEINNTFETLVSSLKDELSLEVAKALFS